MLRTSHFWSLLNVLFLHSKVKPSYKPCSYEIKKEYQPSGEGGTRSPPATPHRLQNRKCPPGGPKMANRVWKGVYLSVFGRSKQLSLIKFFDPSTPSSFWRVTILGGWPSLGYWPTGFGKVSTLRFLIRALILWEKVVTEEKTGNKLGLSWAKLSSSWDLTFINSNLHLVLFIWFIRIGWVDFVF